MCSGFDVQAIYLLLVSQYLSRLYSCKLVISLITNDIKAITKQTGSECCQTGGMM